MRTNDRVKVWGHRGCRGEANLPENSLPAFRAAMNQGADGIELDVFLTRDNHLVVFHDDTLERMTDGKGTITSHSLAELKQLRLKDAHGQLTDAEIPTLAEVLDEVDRFRKRRPSDERARNFVVNIEIKEMKGKDIAQHVSRAIDEQLARGWTPGNFQVSSFDMGSLRKMKAARPEIPRGALFEGPEEPKEPWDISEQLLIAVSPKRWIPSRRRSILRCRR